MATLTVFDLDDTLFKSNAMVLVRDKLTGHIINHLTPAEHNTFNINKEVHEFDFSQFRSSKLFLETAEPIKPMITKFKQIAHNANANPNSRVIILTARSDFDDKDMFLDALRKHGLDPERFHVVRSGNLKEGNTAHKKVVSIKNWLEAYHRVGMPFERVRMYDDNLDNLKASFHASKHWNDVSFEGYLILEDGMMMGVI